jgi:hypothetical protein
MSTFVSGYLEHFADVTRYPELISSAADFLRKPERSFFPTFLSATGKQDWTSAECE